MAGYRPGYTLDEEKAILRYIVDNGEYHRLKGDKLWKDMQEFLVTNRTWQSLKQHFRKQIVFKLYLPFFELTRDQQELIGRPYIQKSVNRPRARLPNSVAGTLNARPLSREAAPADVADQGGERRLAKDFNEMSSSSDSDDEYYIEN